jgi:hypothetical protein
VRLKDHGRVICIHGYINLLGMGSSNINFPKHTGDVNWIKVNWTSIKSNVGFYDENYFIVEYLLTGFLHSGWWSPNWVHSARRPLTGLLYLPRVIVRMENLVE